MRLFSNTLKFQRPVRRPHIKLFQLNFDQRQKEKMSVIHRRLNLMVIHEVWFWETGLPRDATTGHSCGRGPDHVRFQSQKERREHVHFQFHLENFCSAEFRNLFHLSCPFEKKQNRSVSERFDIWKTFVHSQLVSEGNRTDKRRSWFLRTFFSIYRFWGANAA